MITSDDYILGNGQLHERFRVTTEILGALVSSSPRPVTIAQLQSYTGRSAREISRLCAELERSALTEPDKKTRGSWLLACPPSSVTLEDVFRCVIANTDQRKTTTPSQIEFDRTRRDVDLLVTQATIAINQSVFQHLRQFTLDRLKISAAGRPPQRKMERPFTGVDNVYDFEVNSWLI